jgi:mannose-6-phosphate isomerase-like protein (cupin superfamily)
VMPDWLIPGPFPPEFATAERCFMTELMNLDASPEVSLALARVAPGVTTRLHAVAGTIERYVILRGEGIVEIDGRAAPVRPGDVVVIRGAATHFQCRAHRS